MYRIEIPGKPPTLNKVYAQHWRNYHKAKKEWAEVIGWALKASGLPKSLPTPFTLSVTQFSSRLRDTDNCIVAVKFFLDVLTDMSYIPDDNPKYVPTLILNSKKCKTVKEEKMVFIVQCK
jgi:Holliday junction resolvase RusA-like endonuclease